MKKLLLIAVVVGAAGCPRKLPEGDVVGLDGRRAHWTVRREDARTIVTLNDGVKSGTLTIDDRGLTFIDGPRALYVGCNFERCRRLGAPNAEGAPLLKATEPDARRFPWSQFRVDLAQQALQAAAASDEALGQDALVVGSLTTLIAQTAGGLPMLHQAGETPVEAVPTNGVPLERTPVERLPDGGVVGGLAVSRPPANCTGDERKNFGGKLLVTNVNLAPWPVRVNFTVGELNGSSNCYTAPFECVGAPTAGSYTVVPHIAVGVGCPDGFETKTMVVQGKVLANQGLWCRPGTEDTGTGVGVSVEVANIRTLDVQANQVTASNLNTTGRAWIDVVGASCFKPASGTWWKEEASATWITGPAPSNGACYEPSCPPPEQSGMGVVAAAGTPADAGLPACCECTSSSGSTCFDNMTGSQCFASCNPGSTANWSPGKRCVAQHCQ